MERNWMPRRNPSLVHEVVRIAPHLVRYG